MRVQDVLDYKKKENRLLHTVPRDTSLADVAKTLCSKNIGAVLVKEPDGEVLGIVSERDIVRQLAEGADTDTITAGDVMNTRLVTAGLDYDLHVAMDLMTKAQVRHLPVGSRGEFCGIITVRDILGALRDLHQKEFSAFLHTFSNT